MYGWTFVTEARGREVWSIAKHSGDPLVNMENRICVCRLDEQAEHISNVLNAHNLKQPAPPSTVTASANAGSAGSTGAIAEPEG